MRILLLVFLFHSTYCLKFLAFSPQFARSHANFLARISDVLVEAGHEVTIVAPVLTTSFGGPLAKKAKVITIPPCEQAAALDVFLDKVSANIWVMQHSAQLIHEKRKVNALWGHACFSVLDTPGLFESLKAEKFDAAFGEPPDVCGPVLFHLLGIDKWAATYSVAINDVFDITQTPSNPAYVPSMIGAANDAMTFAQRFANTFSFVASNIMSRIVYTDIDAVIRERLPDLPPVMDLLSSNSLVFLNSEPLVDFPKPTSSRVIDIGGITVAEEGHAKVNETWSSILDLRPKTILLSFGSLAKSFSMPDDYKRTIRETIRKFPDVTFIWKYERPDHNISAGIPNLIESTWMPQNDLLHDSRLTAFITHCGQGSTTESIDAAIPVIVIPVLADQLRNSHLVERNGIGIRLEKADLASEGKLEAAVREILSNQSYRKIAREVRQLIADRPFPMKEIFVRNMEFLARHGPLRQFDHYGRHLNFLQYYLIDVVVVVLLSLVALCCVLFLIKLHSLEMTTLRFGFHIDRDFFMSFYYTFLYVYGGAILLVHALMFYLFIFHTKNWARAVRIGYLLNQTQMLAHDVWVCFFFRAYTFQPYPILFFTTPIMTWIGGPNAYIIEKAFMVHAICVLLFMHLMMHQQIMPPNSRLVFPRWSRIAMMCFIYAFLSLNPIVAYFTISNPPNTQEILEREELVWAREMITAVAVLGDLGYCGNYTYIFLVVSTTRFLKKQVVVSSKAMRMRRLIIEVIVKQTAYASIFYIYPVLIYGITCVFQFAFLPDIACFIVRVIFGFTYMTNTTAQFVVMITTNKPFQTVVKDIFVTRFPWCNRRQVNSRTIIVPTSE